MARMVIWVIALVWLVSLAVLVGLRAKATKARLDRAIAERVPNHVEGPRSARSAVPLGS
jgi:hypothetical protein